MSPVLLMIAYAAQTVAQTVEATLPPGPGPLSNPLKGFAPWSTDDTQLNSTTSMAYVDASWKELEPSEGKFAFADWERKSWNTRLAKDKPVVLRVYVDYPSRPSGIPDWLLSAGLRTHSYSDYGGGTSPDYTNPKFQTALLGFISALGKRYNNSPRVAYIQLGLLGFWGEWHTYPRTELFASEKFQEQVVSAYHAAFPDKPLMARNPSYLSCKTPWLGFHDDMIPEDSLGPDAWNFLPSMAAAGLTENWKVAPTGGEMVPGAAEKYLGEGWGQLVEAVRKGHMTWIGPYSPPMVAHPTAQFLERQQELVRLLGYQFRLTSFKGSRTVTSGGIESGQITGINEGVAPFYGNWPVKLALFDSQGSLVESETIGTDVRKWLPGAFSVDLAVPLTAAPGLYRLGVGIMDPATGKAAVDFANRVPSISGFAIVGSVKILAKN